MMPANRPGGVPGVAAEALLWLSAVPRAPGLGRRPQGGSELDPQTSKLSPAAVCQ